MITSAKFEKFCTSHRDEHGLCLFTVKKPDSNEYVDRGTRDALLGWQAALSSLEVTPELTRIACMANLNPLAEPSSTEMRHMADALAAVFAAIKEGKA